MTAPTLAKRSISLDLVKLFLAIEVVAAHMHPLFEPETVFGLMLYNAYGRTIVPIFFIISGYLLGNRIDDWAVVKKYVLHILIIYATWSIFYSQYYITWESPVNIASNLIMGYFQLWYLPSLLFGVGLLYVIRKYIKNDIHLLIIVLLLYLIGHILDPSRPYDIMYRNGLFIGFPLITLGVFIKKYNIQQYFKTWQAVAVLIASFIMLNIEGYFIILVDRNLTDLYLASLFLAPAILIICIKHPMYVNKTKFIEYFSYIPTGIYFIHPFWMYKLYSHTYNIYNLPLVIIMSILTTLPLIWINKKIKIFF